MRSERRGVPAKLYYVVDVERVWEAISSQCSSQESRLQDSCNLDCGDPSSRESVHQDLRDPSIKSSENLQTFFTESTAENTAFSTPDGATMKQALRDWIQAKKRLKEMLAPEEWALWARPAYLLKVMSGNTFLIALPPSNRIAAAAKARLPDLCSVLGRAVGFTRYPDGYERERMKKDYPEIYAQWLGTKEG